MKRLLPLLGCLVSSQLLMAKTVGPLIQTQWDQAAPFNCMIPEKEGQHCLASCGAAAIAQICYYHRWPEHGMGDGSWHFVNGDPVHVDLTQDYYEYDKMLLKYDENSSEESLMATALLIRDVAFLGAVLDLYESYSPPTQELALNFGYDKGMLHLDRGYCTDEDFKSIIRSELDAGRPVLLSGSNGSAGHSLIVDGYRDNEEFHFNYGWAGKYDGWATLENFLFPVSMSIDYNLKKDEGGNSGFTLSSNLDFKWLGGNKLYGSYYLYCHIPWGTKLQVALAVENTSTHEVQYLCTYDRKNGEEKFDLIWELDADLADGDYILYPVAHDAAGDLEWKKSYFRDLCQSEVNLTVKDGVKTFANMHIYDPVREGAVEAESLCYELNETNGTASLTYRNDKYASYSGDVVIPETITVDGKAYTVTSIGKSAFKECKYLRNLTIAKTVTSIEWGAFSHCTIDKVTCAEGSQLKSIEGFAFYCDNIQEIILPEGLKSVGGSAFGNANIGSLTIPSTITDFGQACFETTSLKCVHVNSTTPLAIEPCFRMSDDNDFTPFFELDWADYPISATVLYVPAGAKNAYAQADVWKEFGFILEPGDDDSFVSQLVRDGITIDGIAYQVNGNKSIAQARVIKEEMTDVVFKNEIKLGDKTLAVIKIDNPQGARVINKDYKRVVIPANVETLGKNFAQDAAIGSIEFEAGSHLKALEESALDGMTILSPLVLPDGLETIKGLYLRDADITIPATVTTIEDNYFVNLRHVRVSWTTPLSAPNLFRTSQFEYGNNIDDATLHVPEGTKELYAAAEGWNRFSHIVDGTEPVYQVTMAEGTKDADKWTISPASGSEKTQVTLTYAGEEVIVSVKAVTDNGEISLSSQGENIWTFVMPATNVQIEVEYVAYYNVTLKEGTEDSDKWTISSASAAENTKVTLTYSGDKEIKNVKAVTDNGEFTIWSVGENSYFFYMPAADVQIEVEYVIYYDIAIKEGTEDVDKWTISMTSAIENTRVFLTYTGDKEIKSVKGVTDNGECYIFPFGPNSWLFDMPAADVQIEVEYEVYYDIAMKEGTEDADKWTISPTSAAENTKVTLTYTGDKKIKSVKGVADNGEITIWPIGENSYVLYMPATNVQIEVEYEEESGIASLLNPATDAVWYDLNGHCLDDKPTQKGVYIHKGKKQVIK